MHDRQNLPTTRLSRLRRPAGRATTTGDRQRVKRPRSLHRVKLCERDDHRSYRSCRQSQALSSLVIKTESFMQDKFAGSSCKRFGEEGALGIPTTERSVHFRTMIFVSEQRIWADGEASLMVRWLGPARLDCHCSNRRGVPLLRERKSRAGHVRIQFQRDLQNFGWFCPDAIAISYDS